MTEPAPGVPWMVPVRHRGEIYFYYARAEYWMDERWKRFIADEIIGRAWQWRRWGIDPPVGCNHSISWQAALLAMMPLVYALALSIVTLIES